MMPCDVVPTDARVCGDKASQMSNLIGLAGPFERAMTGCLPPGCK